MKISVIGAGLIGITTAFMLKRAGHDVTLIDRNSGPGQECSFANGAQLSYCHAEAWASYSSLVKAMKWIGKSNAPLLFKPLPDLDMWKWVLKFILQSSSERNFRNTEKILKLGLYSRKILHEIESDFNFDFDYKKGGKIFLFYDQKCFETYLKQARKMELLGSRYQILSSDQAFDYEPSLLDSSVSVHGFLRDPLDESADAYKYCIGMSQQLEKMGVDIKYDTNVEDFEVEGNKIKSIKTSKGQIERDQYLLTAGVYSPKISKQLNLKLPIYPIKGYSITVDIDEGEVAAKNSITDYNEKVVYSNLGGKMRVAGTAEFAGYNTDITKKRIEMLKASTKRLFPKLKNVDSVDKWACLRPSTPDGPPILGKSRFENLLLNTGHGTLGWTQAFASAKLILDYIEGKKPELNMGWYSLERYN